MARSRSADSIARTAMMSRAAASVINDEFARALPRRIQHRVKRPVGRMERSCFIGRAATRLVTSPAALILPESEGRLRDPCRSSEAQLAGKCALSAVSSGFGLDQTRIGVAIL